jgi:hypothetical protein
MKRRQLLTLALLLTPLRMSAFAQSPAAIPRLGLLWINSMDAHYVAMPVPRRDNIRLPTSARIVSTAVTITAINTDAYAVA